VNITALNANIVAIFMASSSCSVGITNNFTLLRPKTIPLTEINNRQVLSLYNAPYP
jgi:hypothetical protein